jgi:hypothetical protein
MNQQDIEEQIKRRIMPTYLKHLAHSQHQRRREISTGDMTPDPTRVEEHCKPIVEEIVRVHGMDFVTVKFQDDSSVLVQCASGEPSNVLINLIVSRS